LLSVLLALLDHSIPQKEESEDSQRLVLLSLVVATARTTRIVAVPAMANTLVAGNLEGLARAAVLGQAVTVLPLLVALVWLRP
jgi:hypothetical protein